MDAKVIIVVLLLAGIIIWLSRESFGRLGPLCGYGAPPCPIGYNRRCSDPYYTPGGQRRCILSEECGYQRPPCPGNTRCHITHTVLSGGEHEGVGFCA